MNIDIYLRTLPEESARLVKDAFAAALWVTDPANFEDDSDSPAVSPGELHRAHPTFNKRPRADLNKALCLLQESGLLSRSEQIPGERGQTKEARRLNTFYNPLTIGERARQMHGEILKSLIAAVQNENARAASRAEAKKIAETPSVAFHGRPDGPPLRVLQKCTVMYGGVLKVYQAGEIIEDYGTKEYMLNGNMPVAPVDQVNLCQCPAHGCGHKFEVVEDGPDDDPVLIYLADVRFNYGISLITRTRGEIESDYGIIKHILEAGRMPVARANASEYGRCPRCNHVFARTAALGDLNQMAALTTK